MLEFLDCIILPYFYSTPWARAVPALCARQLWRFPTSRGRISVVSRMSRGSCRSWCNTLWSTPKNSSSSACSRLEVCSSTAHLVAVKPCSLRRLRMNAKPTSSLSRDQNCSPCGLVNLKPTLGMFSTRWEISISELFKTITSLEL